VLLPSDGVYGLYADAGSERAVARAYALKGRPARQPTALVAASLEALLAWLPELEGRGERIVRALLPGPYTLVLANPARRYPWLAGDTPDAIGVRVAVQPPATAQVLDALGALAATSANPAGAPAPSRLEEVDAALRAGCGAEIDGGALSGSPSTVIDLSGAEPRVLRAGAGAVDEALARAARAMTAAEGG
jgi:L-threonylcarbamoyladenylate synthase